MLTSRLGLAALALGLGASMQASAQQGFGQAVARGTRPRAKQRSMFVDAWYKTRAERREIYKELEKLRHPAGSKLARKASKGQVTIRKGW